jgi:hypothetical protein
VYESDAQATIEAMLDLSPSLDLAHPFLKGLVGQCDTQLSPARPAWQFAAKPLDEAVGVQIGRASIWTRTAGSVNKPGNYYSGSTFDSKTGTNFQDGEKKEDDQKPPKEEPKKKNKCCCVKDLEVIPDNATDTPALKGDKSFEDYWGRIIDDAAKDAGATKEEIDKAKKDTWGDPKKLGKDVGKQKYKDAQGKDQELEIIRFKFEAVGKVEWIEWDGDSEPDCTFDWTVEIDDPVRGKVAAQSDFAKAGQDPNADAGTTGTGGLPGVRVKLDDGSYSWVDATATYGAPYTPGVYKREFVMTFKSADKCPCKKTSVSKTANLDIDTSKNPATISWTVK